MKKGLALLLALILALSLVSCGNSNETPAQSTSAGAEAVESTDTSVEENDSEGLFTLHLGVMTGNQDQWYAVVGDELGIFEQHGIKLDIAEFAAGINTIDAVITEQEDIGFVADYACINRLGNTQDTSNLKIISRLSTYSVDYFYVNPDKIQSLEDLAGKTIITLPGTVWDYKTAAVLDAAKIAKEDQVIVGTDSAQSGVALLISGEGDAMWASGTNGQKLEEAGFVPLVDMEDLGLHTDSYYLTSETFLTEHKDVVEEYLAAAQETADWIYANQDEAAKIIEKRTGNLADQFLTDLSNIHIGISFPQETYDHLVDVKDWAVGNGNFEDFDLKSFMDLSALQEAVPDAEIAELN